MVRGALYLPTSPELRLVIKLQPILKPVQEPVLSQRPQMLLAIRNNKQILKDEMFKQATSPQENAFKQNKNAFLQSNVKPTPNSVPPSAKEKKVKVPSAKESQKVLVFDVDKELEDKIGGCVPAPCNLEPNFEKVFKASIKKGCEAVEIAQEFDETLKQANKEAAKEDKALEEEINQKEEEQDDGELANLLQSLKQDLLDNLEQVLQDLSGYSNTVMETQQVEEAKNKSLLESIQKKKTPATFPTPLRPPAVPNLTTNFLPQTSR